VGVRRRSTARTAMSLVPVVLRGGYPGSHLSLSDSSEAEPPKTIPALWFDLSPLLLGFACLAHHPFAWGEHPSTRVIACTLSLHHGFFLQVDDNPLPLVCGPRTTWLPRVSVRVRPSFYLLQRTGGSKDGRRDDS
jgi:hypothetical protein